MSGDAGKRVDVQGGAGADRTPVRALARDGTNGRNRNGPEDRNRHVPAWRTEGAPGERFPDGSPGPPGPVRLRPGPGAAAGPGWSVHPGAGAAPWTEGWRIPDGGH